MIYGDSLSSLSLASSHSGGTSPFSSTWQVEVMSGPIGSSRVPPILCNTEHAQFVDVSEVDNGGIQ